MNSLGKYLLGGIILAIIAFLCWYFSSIIAYILVSVVISFSRKADYRFVRSYKNTGIRSFRFIEGCCDLSVYMGGFYSFLLYGYSYGESGISVVE